MNSRSVLPQKQVTCTFAGTHYTLWSRLYCDVCVSDVGRAGGHYEGVGIEPDVIVGLSLGELGCSYVDSCFLAEQVVLAAYYSGHAVLETHLIRGSVAAVGKSFTFRHIAQICVSASHIHWLSIRIKRTFFYFTVLNW
jgi:hypothetical protein